MSQTNMSLLEEVVQWSQETCRRELRAVMPKLTALQCNSESWDDHIRILRIITDMFLPHISLAELEKECFSKVLPQVVTMFDNLFEEISNQVGELSSQNTELCALLRNILQAMIQIIHALSDCVRHVGSFEKTPDLEAIYSLPSCILKVLRDTFQHCKDSESVYCGRLSLVADLLQALFKEAYSLQKGLLELLDKVTLDSSASDKEVCDIVTVIHSLFDICSIISTLDMALHANTWKFIIKQSLKYQSMVEEHLRHGDISNSLCDNFLASFHSCVELAEQLKQAGLQEVVQCPEHRLFQKTTKMCRFFANTLVHYIKEFRTFLTKYCSCFHQLYLQIISKFPPSLSAPSIPPSLSEELKIAALVPMDALLLQLLPIRHFAEVVLRQDQGHVAEHELSQCRLLMSVLSQLPSQSEEVLELWYRGSQFSEETPRLPLHQAVFACFRRCHNERRVPVLLPGVMMKGQAQGQVSLHQHVCVQLCASVASLPTVYFPVLERCLLDAVLQCDTQTALLSTDVWCFTARYGTAELCLHHVLLIAQLVKKCPSGGHQSSHLGLLLSRMVFLMTPDHQMQLLERFPPSDMENILVWHQVLLRALCLNVRRRVESDTVTLSEKVLCEWETGGCKLGQVSKMNTLLLSILAVARGLSSPEEECVSSIVRIITQLWLRMCPDQVLEQPILQRTLKLLLSISAALVKRMEFQVIYQTLVCVDTVLSQKCADEVLLAALEFLASLGKVFVPPENQSQILPRLSSMFTRLLSDRSWLIHQHALEAFSHFAEITNHEEVISQSLCGEEMKAKVVNYLSKTINAQEGEESRLERLKSETAVILKHNERLECNEGDGAKRLAAEAVNDEPCPKRARPDSSVEEEYRRYLQTAENALRALQGITQSNGNPTEAPPQWLDARLQQLQTLITNITTSQNATS